MATMTRSKSQVIRGFLPGQTFQHPNDTIVRVSSLYAGPADVNTELLVNVGGGPTPDKPTVTLSPPDPNHINSFMNIRVADIQACYELWKSRGAEFITPPIPKYGEIRCYIRDPDGYIIEIGQSTDLVYG